ncbi:MAG: DUF389 domain-containing protein [Jaaginema sp. PMC 1079.18]|nr:DUF389 domain-containing protein [Jaaginema sp. PMC 1080.18]MEC4851259.1 DUF389 domain-containing protein [Jaaginema sp. PMC 1079.18]MEC4864474.1 DUF389 domain-containing protein [Jaaginema sp. PMC 1078.18]
MRQLILQVPSGQGKTVMEMGQSWGGVNLVCFAGISPEQPVDVVMVYLSNQKVEDFLSALEDIPNLHVTLIPRGVMPLQPPPEEAPEKVIEVQKRSPIEVFLAGLQSVGSWTSFLGYAVLGSIVVWIGLYTNTPYLLVAAMLIAPFAGPAMNTAIATARGDFDLLWRSLVRYFSAIAVSIAIAFLLSVILQQDIITSAAIATSKVSRIAVLLPLIAGTAGALNLMQSERSSLVSGAAVGLLVAASLAPPAGMMGMAIALQRWDMVQSGVFLLLLQLAGINFAAALVFRLYGLSPRGARYKRGKKGIFPLVLAISTAILVALLSWQWVNPPELQRASISQRVVEDIQTQVQQSEFVDLVETETRFTRANIAEQNTLLCLVYVQRRDNVTITDAEIRDRLTQNIQAELQQQRYNITPLVSVTVLNPL